MVCPCSIVTILMYFFNRYGSQYIAFITRTILIVLMSERKWINTISLINEKHIPKTPG